MRNFAAVLAFAFVACNPPEKDGSTSDPDGTVDPPNGNDTASTTDTASGNVDYLEVIALGFEFDGSWDQATGEIEPYLLYPDLNASNGGVPFLISTNFVEVTLASAEYFEGTTDDPDEYCSFDTIFTGFESSASGTQFDWDAGDGGTGVDLLTWGMFDGYLTILPDSLSERCFELDPEQFTGGDPFAMLDGMHFGLGFGPLSPYLEEWLFGTTTPTTSTTGLDYSNSYMTQYIAINHPDGSGGYTFPAYDWNVGLYVDTDYETCANYTYTTTSYTYEVCGLVGVDVDLDQYLPGDVNIQPIHGFQLGNSAWLEDTPNLDLTLMREGNGL